jgi:histidine triad (HIT) family protein
MDCIFCKIASGAIPATLLFEDEEVVAFADRNPQAPVHVLVIPRRHIISLAQAVKTDAAVLGHMLETVAELARTLQLANGYRSVINTGPDGGQTVEHLHVHLLGGRGMSWPPG